MLDKIDSYLREQKMDVVGVADTEGWQSPLAECNPNEILKDCRRIVIFGKEIPHPIYAAEKHAIDLYANVAQNYYYTMDAVATEVATMLTREGHPSIPLGPYLPILMREGKYWGMVSLKHAAVRAGVGTMGKNTLLANEKFGNRLRLGAVLTTADLPAGKPLEESLCKDECRVCVEVCPVRALDGHGGIDQYKCLKNCTSHPLLSTAFLSQWFRHSKMMNKNFQLVTETLGARYTYSCFECLIKCPNFKTGV
jgi:epoxyqueuosine reductase